MTAYIIEGREVDLDLRALDELSADDTRNDLWLEVMEPERADGQPSREVFAKQPNWGLLPRLPRM